MGIVSIFEKFSIAKDNKLKTTEMLPGERN